MIEREERLLDLAEASDATLLRVPTVAPILAKAMEGRTYQRVASRFIVEGWSRGGVLIGDHPGLGKTLEAIGGIIESGVPGPYLVICPKTAVLSVWAREIPRWWPEANPMPLPDGRAKREGIIAGFANLAQMNAEDAARGIESLMPLDKTFLIINPEVARVKAWWVCDRCGDRTKWKAGPKKFECTDGFDPANTGHRENEIEFPRLFDIEWGAIICDESDKMLVRLTGTPTQVRLGAEMLRIRPDGARIPMSGTPFRSRPHLLWGTLNWMYPKEYTSAWRFIEKFWDVTVGGYTGTARKIGQLKPGAEKRMNAELSRVMLRRTKEEVAPDLPPKTYVGTPLNPAEPTSPVAVWLDMDPAQRKLYNQMKDSSVATLAGGSLNAIGVLAEMTRLKQFSISCGRLVEGRNGLEFRPQLPSNKLEYIWAKMEELGFPDDPETKVVVASQFTQIVDLFCTEIERRLGSKYMEKLGIAKITGAITGRKRAETIDAINMPVGSGSPHIVGINTKAGGVAITIDTADHMFITDRTYIPDDQLQLEDRIHRVSAPRPVFYHYLESANSIDQAIAEVNAERAAVSHMALDGRRGIEYARRVLEVMR
jgi:SNF2 family DNA or RNA helicase